MRGIIARGLVSAAVVVAMLVASASAEAVEVGVGPSFRGLFETRACPTASCTYVNSAVGSAGGSLVSPISGTIVSFGILDASPGTYRVGTLTAPGVPPVFAFEGWSEPESKVSEGPLTMFPATLPVVAGQAIALTVSGGTQVSLLKQAGAMVEWQGEQPQIGPASGTAISHDEESVAFFAVVLPPPTITSLVGAVGNAEESTTLMITGSNLEEVTAVTFGNQEALTFDNVGSEKMTAIAPPLPHRIGVAKAVPVTVFTKAGSVTAATPFTYLPTPCVVPRLNGMNLVAAKRALLRAGCRPGTVRKRQGANARTGRVVSQSPRPGVKRTLHARVSLTLG